MEAGIRYALCALLGYVGNSRIHLNVDLTAVIETYACVGLLGNIPLKIISFHLFTYLNENDI